MVVSGHFFRRERAIVDCHVAEFTFECGCSVGAAADVPFFTRGGQVRRQLAFDTGFCAAIEKRLHGITGASQHDVIPGLGFDGRLAREVPVACRAVGEEKATCICLGAADGKLVANAFGIAVVRRPGK